MQSSSAALTQVRESYKKCLMVILASSDLDPNAEQMARVNEKKLSYLTSAAEILWLGTSAYAQRIRKLAVRVAGAPDGGPVMITGESGTGKEQIAKLCAFASLGPCVSVNCAAIPDSLFESEFFGHTRGSFTGAAVDRKGYLELTGSGVLFLDELGEMPLHQQARLLRAIESRQFYAVGQTDTTPKFFSGRVIAATNRPTSRVSEFIRLDLYERLAQYEIALEPLRTHREDAVTLTEEKFYSIIPPNANLAGNVRQLLRLWARWKNLGPEFLTPEDFN